MNIKRLALGLTALTFAIVLAGCETEDDNKIAKAIQCLDEISGSGTSAEEDAKDCYDEVDGVDSADASYIRCVAIFNMRGKFTSNFITAFQALEDTEGSTNNTNIEMMSEIAFFGVDSQTDNSATDDADEVFSECEDADSPGHVMLAAVTQVGTVIAAVAGGTSAGALDGALGGLSGADEAEIGEAAQTAWDNYCDGSSTDNNEFCAALEDAGADDGLSAEALGAALAAELQSNN